MYHGLIDHLPETGVEAQGLVLGNDAELSQSNAPVRAFASAEQSLPLRLWQLRRSASQQLESISFDLVAAHFPLYTLPIIDLAGSSYPLVTHFHGPWASESLAEGESSIKTRLKASIEQFVYRRANRFVVLSSAFRDVLIRSFEVAPERIDIVPGGVDVDRFNCHHSPIEARDHLGWPTDRPIILSVRRLVRRVGLESLVTAMETIRAHVPDALLLMAGKGPLANQLQTQIEVSELQDHVRLLGFVPDEELPVAYRAADISVMPTRALEGFGLSAVESLAAGTPVLVTDVGGLPEVVRDLSEHLIIEDASPEELADRLIAALQGHLDVPSSSACQRYARARFDWPVIASQVRNVYQQVVQ
jgi:glycosyltransferase involved in cell wall biosynthesis